MAAVRNYEEQVYASVLGKVIGVYCGRPFEGWTKDALEQRFGLVDRYVHEDMDKPLVVSDDDISGTLTFIRALEDTGLYKDTPTEAFGDLWLNYLIEHQTVLWWGGMGRSTEHTAWLRLRQGYRAPKSGSIGLNGKVVAEQIGAQIFIDAFGMVAPGNPKLAAELARRSASVSHDGEAIHGAQVVAAMVAAAFVEKHMNKLLNIGVSVIPRDSLIARVHRDVRNWVHQDKDWRNTYKRIFNQYGYKKYGGGCHIVPNHALMVMAWAYAQDDFHKAQTIINTAGWDTDCNAANVGSVMGLVVGLEGINRGYDFQSPFADRILVPTAEGTRAVTDALTEALHIARIGRKVMDWSPVKPPKKGAWHHFEMPGALHGWMSESQSLATSGAKVVSNVPGHSKFGGRTMRIEFAGLSDGKCARVSTPILPSRTAGGYKVMATPRLAPGMTVALRGQVGPHLEGNATAWLFVRYYDPKTQEPTALVYSQPKKLAAGKAIAVSLELPNKSGWPIKDVGIEIDGTDRAAGEVFVDTVTFHGAPKFEFPADLPRTKAGDFVGWVVAADRVDSGPFTVGQPSYLRVSRNLGRGLAVTGTTDWRDYTLQADAAIHLADVGGLVVRYQGLERYMALVQTKAGKLQLIRRWYGADAVLAERPLKWVVDRQHTLKVQCKGKTITAWCDGKKVFAVQDDRLGCGGAGFLSDTGITGFKDAKVFS
jgi:ADP-ribosylglycohydrolase